MDKKMVDIERKKRSKMAKYLETGQKKLQNSTKTEQNCVKLREKEWQITCKKNH